MASWSKVSLEARRKVELEQTYTPVNSDDPELKKDIVVSYMSTTSDVLSALERHV